MAYHVNVNQKVQSSISFDFLFKFNLKYIPIYSFKESKYRINNGLCNGSVY